MFKWLNKQGVESDDGFIVQVRSRYKIEYREISGKSILANMEIGYSSSKPSVILNPRALDQWDGGIPLSAHEKSIVWKNMRDALEFQNLDMLIE